MELHALEICWREDIWQLCEDNTGGILIRKTDDQTQDGLKTLIYTLFL